MTMASPGTMMSRATGQDMRIGGAEGADEDGVEAVDLIPMIADKKSAISIPLESERTVFLVSQPDPTNLSWKGTFVVLTDHCLCLFAGANMEISAIISTLDDSAFKLSMSFFLLCIHVFAFFISLLPYTQPMYSVSF